MRSPPHAHALVVVLAAACSSGDDGSGGAGAGASSTATSSTTSSGSGATASTSSGGAGQGGGSSPEGGGGNGGGPVEEPCPELVAPTSCFGREVMFREWGPDAVGDGTYFADQAPNRLGFTRVRGRMWVVKFQTEENSYFGRVSAYGDSSGGIAWISRAPCDADFAADHELVAWGVHGGGSMDFVVSRDATDDATLDTDPGFASTWGTMPRLRGGYCYYVAFENMAEMPSYPLDASAIEHATDDCGLAGDGTCYYLAFDFNHRLHDITNGQLIAGNVIAGLTH